MSDDKTGGILYRIPDDVTDLRETWLPESERQNVTGLVIPGHIRFVNWDSCPFRNIRNLILEEGVEEIRYYAFGRCKHLETACLPGTLRRIGSCAFIGTALRQLELPENLEELGPGAFRGCRFLTSVRLPASLRVLPHSIFEASGLTSCDLPEGIEEIDLYAFQDCRALEQVKLPGTLRIIRASAFSITGLRELIIPEGVEVLENYAFFKCAALTDVRLPSSLRILGRGAFAMTDSQTVSVFRKDRLQIVFAALPAKVDHQFLSCASKIVFPFDASRDGILDMVRYWLDLSEECELVADGLPLRGLDPDIQMRFFQTWDKRLRRGEPIPEEARANLLDGAKSRKSILWRARILRHLLLEEGLLSLQNVRTFLDEAQQEGDSEVVAQLLEYEHRHFPPEEVERRERRRRQRALRNLPAFEEENPDGA